MRKNHPIIHITNFLVLPGGSSRKMLQAMLVRAALENSIALTSREVKDMISLTKEHRGT